MTIDDVRRLVASGESETLELKATTGQLGRGMETLCGFLNTRGGIVVFGATPDGKLQGQQVSDHTQREIAACLRKFEPPAPIEVEYVPSTASANCIIVFRAGFQGDQLPFTYDGRPYQRVETTTSVMPQERYQQLLLSRVHARSRWENAKSSRSLDDLDREEILRTIRLGIEASRLPEASGGDVGDVLDRLGVRVDGILLNAAVVLFGRRFLPDYPQCQLRMARFKGIDKSEFLDDRQVHGNGFQLLREGMLFLERHLPVAGKIQPGLFERTDSPLFPPVALREALVNAVCHRDYSHPGGAISLAVFDDRLEIWSDGLLPSGITVEDLKRDHQSRPRNPLIAGVFYRRGLVEQWGRGTQKIVELCVRAGHPEPEFVERAGAVGVRFLPSGYIAPHLVAHELMPRHREILLILSRFGPMPLREIRARLENPLSERTIQDDLALLRRLHLIESGGHGRGAKYWLRAEADSGADENSAMKTE